MKKYLEAAIITLIVATLIVGVAEAIKIKNRVSDLEQHHIPEQVEYSYLYDCMMEAELNYLEAKTALTREVQSYIDEVAPTSNVRGYAIVDECEKYNVDICFVLAQGEIESHFGTKGLGAKFNNVFNINVHDNVKGKKDMNKN